MKKAILALLAIFFLLSLVGCPPKGKPEDAFGKGPGPREITQEDPGTPAVDNTPPATTDDDSSGTGNDGSTPGEGEEPGEGTEPGEGGGGEEPATPPDTSGGGE